MTYPTGAIVFTAILGAMREPRSWYLAAHRAESRESTSVNLTREEVVSILCQVNVRKALAGLGVAFSFSAAMADQELVAQLTERVAELQALVDRDRAVLNQARLILGDDGILTWSEILSRLQDLVTRDANIQRAANVSVIGKADEAIALALKRPTLAQALSLVATWDNERAVRQALRNVGPDNRKDASHGGLWDTTFEYLFTRVLDAWQLMIANEPVLLERMRVAESLWQMLDDIDSLSDAIKPRDLEGYTRFCLRAIEITSRRHEFLKSDGNHLTWHDGDKSERKSNYTFAEIPEHDPAISAKYEDLKISVERALRGDQFMAQFPGHAELARHVARLPDTYARYRDLLGVANDTLRGERCATSYAEHAAIGDKILILENMLRRKPDPVPMLLFCPMCHTKHIDEGEFSTKAHHTHACQAMVPELDAWGTARRQRLCGHVWRPAIVPTVGVEALPGFINAQAIETMATRTPEVRDK